jgi:hypothetical protein
LQRAQANKTVSRSTGNKTTDEWSAEQFYRIHLPLRHRTKTNSDTQRPLVHTRGKQLTSAVGLAWLGSAAASDRDTGTGRMRTGNICHYSRKQYNALYWKQVIIIQAVWKQQRIIRAVYVGNALYRDTGEAVTPIPNWRNQIWYT